MATKKTARKKVARSLDRRRRRDCRGGDRRRDFRRSRIAHYRAPAACGRAASHTRTAPARAAAASQGIAGARREGEAEARKKNRSHQGHHS